VFVNSWMKGVRYTLSYPEKQAVWWAGWSHDLLSTSTVWRTQQKTTFKQGHLTAGLHCCLWNCKTFSL
jgi:hypothetical protein